VHGALDKAERYEQCSSSTPPIFLCTDYPRQFEAGTAWYLRSEIGADPGEVYRLAAQTCEAGHPQCQFALEFADWYHDNREIIVVAIIAGDLIPAPPGVKCVVAAADGFTAGDAAECIIGLVPGVPDIPIPSGAIDDGLEGD